MGVQFVIFLKIENKKGWGVWGLFFAPSIQSICSSRWSVSVRLRTNVKHLEKICSVFGGHLISINFPPRNWEAYYAYSSRMGGKLCLLVGGRTLPLLMSRHKNCPIRLVIYTGLVRDR
jgi:hypothetical protein